MYPWTQQLHGYSTVTSTYYLDNLTLSRSRLGLLEYYHQLVCVFRGYQYHSEIRDQKGEQVGERWGIAAMVIMCSEA